LHEELAIRKGIILIGHQNKSLLLWDPLYGAFSAKILDITQVVASIVTLVISQRVDANWEVDTPGGP